MKLFEDKLLTKEVTSVDMGIVLAGDTKRSVFYLYNDTLAECVEIVPVISNKEVKILKCPSKLQSKQVGDIELEWAPALNIKKGLKTEINFKYFELYS